MVELVETEHCCIVGMVPLLDSVPKVLLLALLGHLNKSNKTELMCKKRPKSNDIKIDIFTAKKKKKPCKKGLMVNYKLRKISAT